MTGSSTWHRRCALVAAALVAGALPLAAQPALLVPTTMGVRQSYILGLLSPPMMTVSAISGNTIKSNSTATVRSNASWRLQVTLTAPVATNLTVKVSVGKGKAITLDAGTPSAIVATGTTACRACAVTMDWDFTYKVSGRNAPRPTLAPVTYEVLPPAGVVLSARSTGTAGTSVTTTGVSDTSGSTGNGRKP